MDSVDDSIVDKGHKDDNKMSINDDNDMTLPIHESDNDNTVESNANNLMRSIESDSTTRSSTTSNKESDSSSDNSDEELLSISSEYFNENGSSIDSDSITSSEDEEYYDEDYDGFQSDEEANNAVGWRGTAASAWGNLWTRAGANSSIRQRNTGSASYFTNKTELKGRIDVKISAEEHYDQENRNGKDSDPENDQKQEQNYSSSRRKYSLRKNKNIYFRCIDYFSSPSSSRKTTTRNKKSRRLFKFSWTTVFLLGSMMVWLIIQLYVTYSSTRQSPTRWIKPKNKLTRAEMLKLRQERAKRARKALGSAADAISDQRGGGENSFWNAASFGISNMFTSHRRRQRQGRARDIELLPPGCHATDWHVKSFPTCNLVHEVDLRSMMKKTAQTNNDKKHYNSTNSSSSAKSLHQNNYIQTTTGSSTLLGSGLWRDAWKVYHNSDDWPFVLKMMKAQHNVDRRNMDRHRRDALVMERLTHSPHIVSIHGYCGNSVLTEYAGRDLDSVVYPKKKKKQTTSMISPSRFFENRNDSKDQNVDDKNLASAVSRASPEERLQLSLQVAKAIRDLHAFPGGPIIHADITTKQFLIDDKGRVKLNDFNRCRFVPHKILSRNNSAIDDYNVTAQNETTIDLLHMGDPCEIHIPSAPGNYRSPEEYNSKGLTPQIDVYSVAHVLMGILTGDKPWGVHAKVSDVKQKVRHGKKPPAIRIPTMGPIDKGLEHLINWAYEFNPKNRINATQLVHKLEAIQSFS